MNENEYESTEEFERVFDQMTFHFSLDESADRDPIKWTEGYLRKNESRFSVDVDVIMKAIDMRVHQNSREASKRSSGGSLRAITSARTITDAMRWIGRFMPRRERSDFFDPSLDDLYADIVETLLTRPGTWRRRVFLLGALWTGLLTCLQAIGLAMVAPITRVTESIWIKKQ
ncbi:MAG TPA: hypothetical protein DDW52_17070 [Planctomycetaceae bacterium]|nr:hypothetical protein [Planctomycetaceae bacterium]